MSTRNFSNKPNLQNIQDSDFQVNVKNNIYKPVFGHNDEPGTLLPKVSVLGSGITTTTTTIPVSTGRGTQGPVGPAGTQGFQGIAGSGGSGGGGAPISKTFAQLVTLKQAGQLVAGQQYLMTDYKTVYIRPNTNILKTDAVVEPLILTAIAGATCPTKVNSRIDICVRGSGNTRYPYIDMIDITKLRDSWFLVQYTDPSDIWGLSGSKLYKCDEFSGLIKIT